ncbi:threonine/serine exporter family protein [Stomatobaculum longum]|uniref:threonine/serine exporter family protein n=1 Tax=Stomatobaculum longum TaxID=796942 RepID=UPI0028807BE9|nr:threonine/serine exporter family protein [Stomatobaculum longum]
MSEAMRTVVIQLLSAFMGAGSFAILFQLKRKYLFIAALGGALEWGVYLLLMKLIGAVFPASFLASAFTALYAELLARWQRAPVTIFFISGIIPLVPGSSLYYTMSAIVHGDSEAASYYSSRTIQYAFAIAAGISVITAVFEMWRTLKAKLKKEARRNRQNNL